MKLPQAPKTAKSPGSAAILATGNGVLSDDDIDEFSDDEFDNAGLTKISDVFKRKEGQGGSQSSQKEKENVQEVARSPAEKKKKLQVSRARIGQRTGLTEGGELPSTSPVHLLVSNANLLCSPRST